MWRQRRRVHAESSSIALRTHEKSGPAVQEFRKYVLDALGDQGAKRALETSPIDDGTIDLFAEIDGFDPSYVNALDSELYKTMRALREAQAWCLASLEQIFG